MPMRVAWLSLVGSVAILALKGVAYFVTGSVGFLSDAAESLVNLVAAGVLLLALYVSRAPPDYEHPYGHTKAEYLSFFFSSRRRHTSCGRDWSSDVCSSDLILCQHVLEFFCLCSLGLQCLLLLPQTLFKFLLDTEHGLVATTLQFLELSLYLPLTLDRKSVV